MSKNCGPDHFQCDVCFKRSPTKNNLTYIYTHICTSCKGQKDHQCLTCYRLFLQKSHMKNHFKIHMGAEAHIWCAIRNLLKRGLYDLYEGPFKSIKLLEVLV